MSAISKLLGLMPAGSPLDGGLAEEQQRAFSEAQAARDAVNRKIGGTPPPPVPVPAPIREVVHMPRLAAVVALRAQKAQSDEQEAVVRAEAQAERTRYAAATQVATEAQAERLAGGASVPEAEERKLVKAAREHAERMAAYEARIALFEPTRRHLERRFQAELATEILKFWTARRELRARERSIQVAALQAFSESQQRELAAEAQAHQELGRAHKILRDLDLPAPWIVSGGELLTREEPGFTVAVGRTPETRRLADTSDLMIIRRFFEDQNLGVDLLVHSPRANAITAAQIQAWQAAAAREGP